MDIFEFWGSLFTKAISTLTNLTLPSGGSLLFLIIGFMVVSGIVSFIFFRRS